MRLIDADLLTTEIIKISGVIPNFNEDVALCSVDSMPTVRAVPLAEFTCVQKQLILRNAQLLEAKEKNEIHGARSPVQRLQVLQTG